MAIASGANVTVALKKETTLGTAATGNYAKVALYSFEMSPSQAFIEAALLGQGRDPPRAQRDVTDLTGRAVIPLDLRAIGHWMNMCFGAPVTTGSGPYTHVWKSGATALVGYSIEQQHPDLTTPQYFANLGVVVQGFSFDLAPNGELRFNVDLFAASHARSTTSIAGTPTTIDTQQFSQFQGALKKDTVAVAKVLRAPLNFRNNHEQVRYVGGAGAVGDTAPGLTSSGGSIVAAFSDATLFAVAEANTVFDLEHVFTIDADNKITFELEQAEIARAGAPVTGAGRIECNFEMRGSKDTSEGQMMKVTLINDVATY
jgi:hypothetical protein